MKHAISFATQPMLDFDGPLKARHILELPYDLHALLRYRGPFHEFSTLDTVRDWLEREEPLRGFGPARRRQLREILDEMARTKPAWQR